MSLAIQDVMDLLRIQSPDQVLSVEAKELFRLL